MSASLAVLAGGLSGMGDNLPHRSRSVVVWSPDRGGGRRLRLGKIPVPGACGQARDASEGADPFRRSLRSM